MEEKQMIKTAIKIVGIFVGALTLFNSFEIVDEGYRGFYKSLGSVSDKFYEPGMHFKIPFISSINEFEVREQREEQKAAAYTKDTQTVEISFIATYYAKPSSVVSIYKQFGWEWKEKAVLPEIQASLKNTVGQFIADDLVHKREAATQQAFISLKQTLEAKGVVLASLNLVNLDFNDEYEKAVESKVVAVQRANESKNKTVEIEERSKQIVLTAKAESEAMRIKSQALSQNKGLIQYEAIQKWNGVLPINIYGSAPIPFLNIGQGN
jgi:regulator of protease activity HflC (stomatin/prohibitin superfamily)